MRYRAAPNWPAPPPGWQPARRWRTRSRLSTRRGWRYWTDEPGVDRRALGWAVVWLIPCAVMLVLTALVLAAEWAGWVTETVTIEGGDGRVSSIELDGAP